MLNAWNAVVSVDHWLPHFPLKLRVLVMLAEVEM